MSVAYRIAGKMSQDRNDLTQIDGDKRFEVIIASEEKLGFRIARFEP